MSTGTGGKIPFLGTSFILTVRDYDTKVVPHPQSQGCSRDVTSAEPPQTPIKNSNMPPGAEEKGQVLAASSLAGGKLPAHRIKGELCRGFLKWAGLCLHL